MRFFVFFWVAVEVLQIAAVGLLAVGYRNLQRQLERERGFRDRPPRSVTEG